MAKFNQLTIVGRIGRDPEMAYTPDGKAVTKFSVAVDRGSKEQKAMWLNVVAWQNLAEIVNNYARKGQEVFVQGRLDLRSYTDKSGTERTSVDVIASTVQLFGGKPQNGESKPSDGSLEGNEHDPF